MAGILICKGNKYYSKNQEQFIEDPSKATVYRKLPEASCFLLMLTDSYNKEDLYLIDAEKAIEEYEAQKNAWYNADTAAEAYDKYLKNINTSADITSFMNGNTFGYYNFAKKLRKILDDSWDLRVVDSMVSNVINEIENS